jgi:hypothetical protein
MNQPEILEIIGNALDHLDNTLIIDLPRWAQRGNHRWKLN